MKAVVDRIVQYANRYQLTDVSTGEVLGTFDFDEVTGTVQQVGTEIDAELFQSIADDLAARVVSNGGELSGTIVTFSDISGTAANVASGDTSATLWGKVKNWFSRLKALAFKDKVSNTDVADDAAIAQSKISGLESSLAAKADDADLSTIAKTGELADAIQDETHRLVTDTEKATWNAKANDADLAEIAKTGNLSDATQDATHRTVTDTEKATWNAKQSALTFDSTPTANSTNPVTSEGVKTALDEKQSTITGAATSITNKNLTESRAVISDANGKVAVSHVTATELGYLDGVTENIQTQIDEIEDGTTTVGEAEHAKKNDYNLGAYDTYVDNGDGTATITRKTYTVLDYASLDWYFGTTTGGGGDAFYCGLSGNFDDSDVTKLIISNTSKITVGNGNANYTTRLTNGGGVQIVLPTSITNGSADALRDYLNEGGNIIAQMPIATSYTEEVILDKPIHTLDVNGEQFVRNEWEKTLNVFNGSRRLADWGLRVGSVYTIYAVKNHVKISKFWHSNDSTGEVMHDINNNAIDSPGNHTFVYNTNQEWSIFIDPTSNQGNENLADYQIMCCAGSHAYPYQPYNGAIVHEKQLNEALEDYLPLLYPVGSIYMSTVDTSPASFIGGTWERYAQGRVPVGYSSSDSDFDSVGATGGAKTVTLTTSQIPSHSHTGTDRQLAGRQNGSGAATTSTYRTATAQWNVTEVTEFTNYLSGGTLRYNTIISSYGVREGGGGSHNNLQPYIVCYMWRRIA